MHLFVFSFWCCKTALPALLPRPGPAASWDSYNTAIPGGTVLCILPPATRPYLTVVHALLISLAVWKRYGGRGLIGWWISTLSCVSCNWTVYTTYIFRLSIFTVNALNVYGRPDYFLCFFTFLDCHLWHHSYSSIKSHGRIRKNTYLLFIVILKCTFKALF